MPVPRTMSWQAKATGLNGHERDLRLDGSHTGQPRGCGAVHRVRVEQRTGALATL
jgi:hypothetical protein